MWLADFIVHGHTDIMQYENDNIERLYVYNTTKMFMWCCICYSIGLAIVLFYTDELAANNKFAFDDPKLGKTIIEVLSDMGGSKQNWCGILGFINLYFYDVNVH